MDKNDWWTGDLWEVQRRNTTAIWHLRCWQMTPSLWLSWTVISNVHWRGLQLTTNSYFCCTFVVLVTRRVWQVSVSAGQLMVFAVKAAWENWIWAVVIVNRHYSLPAFLLEQRYRRRHTVRSFQKMQRCATLCRNPSWALCTQSSQCITTSDAM